MTNYDDYAQALTKGDDIARAKAARAMIASNGGTAARLEAPDAILKAALWYAGQGIPVFPVMPGDKRPATEHGFKDALTDPDFIRAAWSIQPLYNIGAPTGVLFDVVDIDGEDGVNAVMRGHDAWRNGLIGHALTQRRHGHHLYYKPTGKGNATAVMPGVDLRGDGGYVLLPPSIGANGKRYTWIKPLELGK